ncbi:MAG TPA: DUF4398 domain-containing protein [Burkholderiales bacterium]|nr:DUF4398 domain-containing protein [Burkholderiales bacterium]
MRAIRLWLIGLLVLLLASCASAPTQEMADARSAIRAAEQVGAAPYAAEQMNEAQAALSGAEVNLALGDYSKAKDWALLARDKASEALLIAQAIQEAEQAANAANSMGYLPIQVEVLLREARSLVTEDPDQAILDAQLATKLADEAVNQGELERAEAELRVCKAHGSAAQHVLRQVRSYLDAHKGSAALDALHAVCPSKRR